MPVEQRPQRNPKSSPRLVVPGLENRPDLQLRYERELARSIGCSQCQKTAVLRKYRQLAR